MNNIKYLHIFLFLIFLLNDALIVGSYKNNNLPCPIYLSPSGIVGILPFFDWTDVDGAITYELQISMSSGFTLIILDIELRKSQFQVIIPLQGNTTYFWRVRATDDRAYGPFCSAASFTTIP